MEQETIILIWLILGFINIIILQYVFKKLPNVQYEHYKRGQIYRIGLLTVWFVFGFIIIPIIIIKYSMKYLLIKLNNTLIFLQEYIKK